MEPMRLNLWAPHLHRPYPGLGCKMEPRWNDIINEDGVDDDNVSVTVQRGTGKKGCTEPRELVGKLFWIKMNRKGLMKVSKSQFIKVRRHILTWS